MNKLRTHLAEVASAIREKKGTSEPIVAENFAAEIRSIEAGGEQPSVEEKDVNFYDYDGTLLFSYTLAEAQTLTELPTPKGHEGLVFQGWNWDYEDVIALDYPMDIGALYVTDDGKTRLYLEVEEDNTTITLSIDSPTQKVEVDFGDGATTEVSATTQIEHIYKKGSYILTLYAESGRYGLIPSNANYNCIGRCKGRERFTLKQVECAYNVYFGSYSFQYCPDLKTTTCPLASIYSHWGWTNTFRGCTSLIGFNFPKNMQYIFTDYFRDCINLRRVTIGNVALSTNASPFMGTGIETVRISNKNTTLNLDFRNSRLEKFYFPTSITALAARTFSKCQRLLTFEEPNTATTFGCYLYAESPNLNSIKLSEARTTLDDHTFQDCYSLGELSFPPTIGSIGSYAFWNAGVILFDFRRHTSVPILRNISAFTGIPSIAKIVVPDALYDEWIAATNWSTYADKIVKSSEYTD